jgi:hypothetical protein
MYQKFSHTALGKATKVILRLRITVLVLLGDLLYQRFFS